MFIKRAENENNCCQLFIILLFEPTFKDRVGENVLIPLFLNKVAFGQHAFVTGNRANYTWMYYTSMYNFIDSDAKQVFSTNIVVLLFIAFSLLVSC